MTIFAVLITAALMIFFWRFTLALLVIVVVALLLLGLSTALHLRSDLAALRPSVAVVTSSHR